MKYGGVSLLLHVGLVGQGHVEVVMIPDIVMSKIRGAALCSRCSDFVCILEARPLH
jgi:hypothetical protein